VCSEHLVCSGKLCLVPLLHCSAAKGVKSAMLWEIAPSGLVFLGKREVPVVLRATRLAEKNGSYSDTEAPE